MATSQTRQISSGIASCPLFLTNFSTCAWTLTFEAFIHQYKPPSPSLGRIAPKQRSVFILHGKKIKKKLFFQLSNLSSKLLCAATFSTVYSSKSYSKKEKCGSSYTCVHICAHTNTGRAVWLEEVVYLALARSHEGTMARLKMIGHVVC